MLFVFVWPVVAVSQQFERKELDMRRAAEPPVIDGLLDEEVWLTAPVARNFLMLNPGNGPSERPSQKSEVRMLFDDEVLETHDQ